ncbi:MAG: hypothetical protein CMJ83_07600 [Planctomycetes bacterium]|nr:hypothetical protein [Planctomycetota bacterium]
MASPADKPRFDPDAVSRVADTEFGLAVRAVLELDGESDQNFRLDLSDGRRCVLKIAHPETERAVLELQHAVLAHLRSAGIGGCPTVMASPDGRDLCRVDGEKGASWVRVLTWINGHPLGRANPPTNDLLRDLGAWLGRLTIAMDGFDHPAADWYAPWSLVHAGDEIAARLDDIDDAARHAIAARRLDRFRSEVGPRLAALPTAIIHGDANDWNVLVETERAGPSRICGLIDFGDVVRAPRVCEPAIAAGYAMLGKRDPLATLAAVAKGFHDVCPLTEPEVDVLGDLAIIRLVVSVAFAARQTKEAPHNEYLSVTQGPAWTTLALLEGHHPHLIRATVRNACGFDACPRSRATVDWLDEHAADAAPVVDVPDPTHHVLDLSVEGPGLGRDGDTTAEVSRRMVRELEDAAATVGVGRYDEVRRCYLGSRFQTESDDSPERRTVHLGIDLFVPAGTPVCTPFAAEVATVQDNAGRLDYGPTVILRHRPPEGPEWWSLYGHLSREVVGRLSAGTQLGPGDAFAHVGPWPENGDWPPHVHFQIITDLLGRDGEFPGVAAPSTRDVWTSLSPDPGPILGLPPSARAPRGKSRDELLEDRRERTGRNLSTSYTEPLKIVRGEGAWLFDADGQAYLDGVNNVCHVGHAHPHVVAAAARQSGILNTNTRYLHDGLTAYAERLTALFPDALSVCFFCCSGSEANELALRLARTATGRSDVLCLDGAYHGNTGTLVDLSPYKHAGAGGAGAPPWVHVAPLPDPYRGRYRDGRDENPGAHYARDLATIVDRLAAEGRPPAAFLAESLPGCGGQIVLPDGYLEAAFSAVRAAGGLCIADEVQVGFGRVGDAWWGFELQRVVPDIVTLGKPIGNGHPLAAVITTPAIADAFANGMEYFNTFGGNPVSCAIGMAVLDVLEREDLRGNAREVGAHLLKGLDGLATRHPLIGDVRGKGLYLGVELVTDAESRMPATAEASWIVNRLRQRGILLSTDGPHANVLKLKPPLVWSKENADALLHELEVVLREDALAARREE